MRYPKELLLLLLVCHLKCHQQNWKKSIHINSSSDRKRDTHTPSHTHTLISIAITSYDSVGKCARINRLRVCRFKATNAT